MYVSYGCIRQFQRFLEIGPVSYQYALCDFKTVHVYLTVELCAFHIHFAVNRSISENHFLKLSRVLIFFAHKQIRADMHGVHIQRSADRSSFQIHRSVRYGAAEVDILKTGAASKEQAVLHMNPLHIQFALERRPLEGKNRMRLCVHQVHSGVKPGKTKEQRIVKDSKRQVKGRFDPSSYDADTPARDIL